MNRVLVTLVFFMLVFAAYGQQSEVREVGSFRGIRAAEGVDVYLKKGDREAVRVEVGGNTELSHIVTEVSGDYLRIHVREGRFRRNVNARVFVTYRDIDRISTSSAANVYSDGVLRARNLEIECASAASVEIDIEVNDLQVRVSSAGDVELEGKAGKADFSVSSAGEIDAYDLQVDVLSVEASTAGSAKVHVVKELNARASTAANIRYRGNPTKSRTDSSTGGSVKKSY
ncbi:MAG TPA: head GIN domain-containing protein [Cyclobacteriaceae bacterium]|nr:head GIN domain-containing protein [Cyclobacteriaceae bacterium]